MVDFLAQHFYINNILTNFDNEYEIIFIDKYFFNKANDSKNESLKMIEKLNLNFTSKSNLNLATKSFKNKNITKLTDYYALPFLLMQKMIDSIDNRGCVIGRIKINNQIW